MIRVFDGEPRAALIGRKPRGRRRGGPLRWSMPKGHVEPGETLEQTAMREVQEETGITGTVLASLGSFSYTFTAGGRRIAKRVHHFLMRAESGELTDTDIEVDAVDWVPVDELPHVLAFPAERRIARKAAKLLADRL